MSQLDALREAYNRGILPPPMKAAFEDLQGRMAREASTMTPQDIEIARTKNTPLGDYLRAQASQPRPGETPEQTFQRQYGGLPQQTTPGTAEGMARAALQGVTFGFGDEAVAGAAAALDPLVQGSGGTFPERYEQYVGRERGQLDRFREQSPVTAYGTEIAGAVPTALLPMGALGRAAQTGSLSTRAAAGGTIAAGQGGVYGFGTGEGSAGERLKNARDSAFLGGAIGLSAPIAAKGVQIFGKRLAENQAVRRLLAKAPTTEGLKESAKEAYARVRQAGVTIKPERLARFATELQQDLASEAIDPTLHPRATAIMDRFSKITPDTDFMTMRRLAAEVAGSTDPSEARLGSMMVNAVDDMIDSLTPNDVIAGNTKNLARNLREARDLWGRFRRSEMIDDAFTRADLQASGVENGLRIRFRQILNNRKLRRGFTDDEVAAMERVVKGTFTGNSLRRLARMMSMGSGQQTNMLGATLSSALGGAGGAAVAGAPGAAIGAFAPPVIGALAQKGAERSSKRAADIAKAMIADRKAWRAPAVRNTVSNLLQLIMQRNVSVTGPMSEAIVQP